MDPITGPIVLWLLILWYLWAYFGGRFKTALRQQVQARALDVAAAAAGGIGARRWQQRARDAATRARKPTTPAGPRTAAGQTQAAQDAAGTSWWRRMKVAWADATAAAAAAVARAAKARARQTHTGEPADSWRDRWRTWTAWPAGDEPQAPKYVPSTRDDRPSPAVPSDAIGPAPGALDPAPPPPPVNNPNPDLAPQPQAAAWSAWNPAPITTSGRTEAMPLGIGSGAGGAVATANPGGVAAAESGLSQYINYTGRMGLQCGAAHASILRTLAALGNEAWTGVFADTLKRAAQAMKTAEQEFGTANAALISCLDIRGAYNANAGAGERDSILH